MDNVAAHEAELTAYTLEKLSALPQVRVYGDRKPSLAHDRLGVIPFEIEGISHFLVAAVLGYEFGIGVRSGCFCAHPYILSAQAARDALDELRTTLGFGMRMILFIILPAMVGLIL